MFHLTLLHVDNPIFCDGKEPFLKHIHEISNYDIWALGYHRHEDFCEIVLVLDGEANIRLDYMNYIVKKGDLMLFNKKQLHYEQSHKGHLHMISLGICGLHIQGLAPDQIVPPDKAPIVETGEYYELMRGLMNATLNECKEGKADFTSRCRAYVVALVSLVCGRLWKERRDGERLDGKAAEELSGAAAAYHVKEYIDEHYNRSISMEALAARFSYSPYYIAHEFKKMFGVSTMQYLVQRRLGEAQILLMKSDQPVVEISREVGYENVNNFFVQFKKFVGMSPNTYRHTVRGNAHG